MHVRFSPKPITSLALDLALSFTTLLLLLQIAKTSFDGHCTLISIVQGPSLRLHLSRPSRH
jgi:hypothetical protein